MKRGGYHPITTNDTTSHRCSSSTSVISSIVALTGAGGEHRANDADRLGAGETALDEGFVQLMKLHRGLVKGAQVFTRHHRPVPSPRRRSSVGGIRCTRERRGPRPTRIRRSPRTVLRRPGRTPFSSAGSRLSAEQAGRSGPVPHEVGGLVVAILAGVLRVADRAPALHLVVRVVDRP